MKRVLRNSTIFLGVILITLIYPRETCAFHGEEEGNVDYCKECHLLQNPEESRPEGTESDDISRVTPLLKSGEPSFTCLRCHGKENEFYGVFSRDGSRYTPGGDFYWLKRTFTWNIYGRQYQSRGDDHGHNVVAMEYGLSEDRTLTRAPGGEYRADAMGCTSCHDPHARTRNSGDPGPISVSSSFGQVPAEGSSAGNYRLLGGIGYSGGSQAGGFSFRHEAPVAAVDFADWSETDSNHTAYGSGMSEWCGNCHADFLNSATKHPSGNGSRLTSAMVSNYNAYIRTGDLTGTPDDAYLALVPFECGTEDPFFLDPRSPSGPESAGRANVMCLTCHRAHASAFQNIGRWDFTATFIAESHPGPGDGGASGNDILNSYYGRNMVAQFGRYQRQLCNKCHLKD